MSPTASPYMAPFAASYTSPYPATYASPYLTSSTSRYNSQYNIHRSWPYASVSTGPYSAAYSAPSPAMSTALSTAPQWAPYTNALPVSAAMPAGTNAQNPTMIASGSGSLIQSAPPQSLRRARTRYACAACKKTFYSKSNVKRHYDPKTCSDYDGRHPEAYKSW